MKIAFIIQRYGTEILGGSEYHCRLIAERLAQRHQVEVLTTCARDYITWQNEYPEAPDRIRGVTVRRFANARTRDIEAFNRYSDWIFSTPHTAADEMEWLQQQGPWCPALIEYLEKHQASYDALVFFTYLYAPTVLGLKVAPSKSILVPTAHDEPAIHLSIYKEVFALPAAIALQHRGRAAVPDLDVHDQRAGPRKRSGCGVDLPQHHAYPRQSPGPADATEAATTPRRAARRARPAPLPVAPHVARRHLPAAAPAARAVRCSTAGASRRARAARS